MRTTRMMAVPAAAAVLLLPLATPAAGGEDPQRYIGVRYDSGGVATPIDGPVPEVDALADEITAVGRWTVAEVAERRRQLPYGQIETEAPPAPHQLVTYPGPAGIAPSDQYEVSVEQRGRSQESFVYKTEARKPDTNRGTDTSWTSFSFAGPVIVSVRKLHGEATG
jgi:hypothetical protein